MIVPVPAIPGAGRLVYPVSCRRRLRGDEPHRHVSAFQRLFFDVATAEDERAHRTKGFYEEYFAVLDMTAEFYLDTVLRVFQRHDLHAERFKWRGRPSTLRRSPTSRC